MLFLSMKCPIPAWTSRSLLSSLGLLILLTFACSDSPPPTPTEPTYVDAEFRVQAEPERLRVSGATPGTSLALYDSEGMMVDEGVADEQGEFVFVGLETGSGYVIRETSGQEREESVSLTVFAASSFSVRESIRQLHITDAAEGATLSLYSPTGELLEEGNADALGSLIFRDIPAAEGYVIQSMEGGVPTITDPLNVMSVENSLPAPEFYSSQTLTPGFNYITTRDGTTLSAYVYLPGPPEDGPYPIIVNYSGYEPSRPGAPYDPAFAELCANFDLLPPDNLLKLFPVLCDVPGNIGTDPAGLIGGIFGFGSVGVNVRGTGCSGGAYDYFEEPQVTDGYDLVEVISNQEWTQHGKVGLAGLSYPGITQLFVAQTQPPGLASIAPMSVLADTVTSTLAPGGIFNPGFALQWADNVYNSAAPYGQSWSNDRIAVEAESGVTTCDDNQKLHGQAVDSVEKALQYTYYEPGVADPLNPTLFADQIEVPVFLAGQWQDEQTGPHFATLIDKFTNVPAIRSILTNGLHADGYSPNVISEWVSFLQLYVSKEVPYVDPASAAYSSELFSAFLGTPVALPTLPFSDEDIPGITYEEAKSGFESQPPVRVIFENGYGPAAIGAPVGAFDLEFSQYPPLETVALRLYMNADGSLRSTPPEEEQSASSYLHDPEAGRRTFGGSQPFYTWPQTPPDSAVVFISDPLDEDLIMLGSGSVDLYLQSDADEAELEVTLSEVSPEGNETYVQGGWLRATQRYLADDATELRPIKTHLEEDALPVSSTEWNLTRVEIMPFGHVFRAGSRIVIKVDTPGDSRELWEFTLEVTETDIRNRIAHEAGHPSSVALPVIAGAVVPAEAGRPECPSLRGQPCRAYEPYVNTLEP